MTDTKMSHHHIFKAITTLCISLCCIAEGCKTQSFRGEHPGTDMKEMVDYYTREG